MQLLQLREAASLLTLLQLIFLPHFGLEEHKKICTTHPRVLAVVLCGASLWFKFIWFNVIAPSAKTLCVIMHNSQVAIVVASDGSAASGIISFIYSFICCLGHSLTCFVHWPGQATHTRFTFCTLLKIMIFSAASMHITHSFQSVHIFFSISDYYIFFPRLPFALHHKLCI